MADDDNDQDDGKSAYSSSSDDRSSSKLQRGLTAAGKTVRDAGERISAQAQSQAASRSDERSPNSQPRSYDSFKRGGKVRKTGKARLHKGEVLKRKKKRHRGRF